MGIEGRKLYTCGRPGYFYISVNFAFDGNFIRTQKKFDKKFHEKIFGGGGIRIHIFFYNPLRQFSHERIFVDCGNT